MHVVASPERRRPSEGGQPAYSSRSAMTVFAWVATIVSAAVGCSSISLSHSGAWLKIMPIDPIST